MIKQGVNALDRSWHACLMMIQVGMFVIWPEWAWAQSTSSGLPMEDVFCTACQWLTGPVGRAIATICMAITGLGATLGKITWGLVMVVGMNLATIFGAAVVVDSLAGDAAITQCDASILNQESGGTSYIPNFNAFAGRRGGSYITR